MAKPKALGVIFIFKIQTLAEKRQHPHPTTQIPADCREDYFAFSFIDWQCEPGVEMRGRKWLTEQHQATDHRQHRGKRQLQGSWRQAVCKTGAQGRAQGAGCAQG